MTFSRFGLAVWMLLCLFAGNGRAADRSIDELLEQVHREAAISPAPRCDDATFLRRLSLDLIGRVPTAGELTEFQEDPDRAAAVDRLLASHEHPQFWSHLWTTMLVGRAPRRFVETEGLRQWLEQNLAEQVPVNQIAFDLIAAQGVTSLDGPVNFIFANRDDPVMRLSRTFLSVQLDCAQCHDHPYDRWTNDDYVAMKRFFEPLVVREVSGGVAVSDRGIDPGRPTPVFLTGRKPQTGAWRRELAWMVVQSKPFSRAMVNRTWYWLMGRGMVDPVDAWSRRNPPRTHELLESLASDFRDNDYQLRSLIRRICLSGAYQRQPTETDTESQQAETMRALFAARTIRPQLPEQWLMSVAQVLDRPLPSPTQLAEQSRRLLALSPTSPTGNDPYHWSATTQTLINQLSRDIPPPLRDLEQVYLATLARPPTAEERTLAAGHKSGSVLFALVHCNEFVMND